MFPWGRKCIAFCGLQSWNPTPLFEARIIACTRNKKRRFMDFWCVGTKFWKRQKISCDNRSHNVVRCPRSVGRTRDAFQRRPRNFTNKPTAFSSCYFAQKTEICDYSLQFSKRKHTKIMIEESDFFRSIFPHCIGRDLPRQTVHFC